MYWYANKNLIKIIGRRHLSFLASKNVGWGQSNDPPIKLRKPFFDVKRSESLASKKLLSKERCHQYECWAGVEPWGRNLFYITRFSDFQLLPLPTTARKSFSAFCSDPKSADHKEKRACANHTNFYQINTAAQIRLKSGPKFIISVSEMVQSELGRLAPWFCRDSALKVEPTAANPGYALAQWF